MLNSQRAALSFFWSQVSLSMSPLLRLSLFFQTVRRELIDALALLTFKPFSLFAILSQASQMVAMNLRVSRLICAS
jgi:hypothetical protein